MDKILQKLQKENPTITMQVELKIHLVDIAKLSKGFKYIEVQLDEETYYLSSTRPLVHEKETQVTVTQVSMAHPVKRNKDMSPSKMAKDLIHSKGSLKLSDLEELAEEYGYDRNGVRVAFARLKNSGKYDYIHSPPTLVHKSLNRPLNQNKEGEVE